MAENPPFAELFWGGYLAALVDAGTVTPETPRVEVERIKAEFMAGLRGEPDDR